MEFRKHEEYPKDQATVNSASEAAGLRTRFPEKKNPVAAHLNTLALLHENKNREYGNAYESAGAVMLAMMGGETTLRSPLDYARFCTFSMVVGKMHRYAKNFAKGHADSLDDIAVYASMLRELDKDILKGQEF